MKYKYQISASISTTTLRKIYAVLDDEVIPFSANVRKIGKDARKGDKTHLITIDTNDCNHFESIISKCKNGL